jgi:pantothenate kinase-related protein Tda10
VPFKRRILMILDTGAIAGRVAETILVLEPPLTIGLFGPWGSGKTSMYELLRRELEAKDRKTQLAYYD